MGSVFQRYFPKARWALVYWDDTALIFIRRLREFSALIDANEFRDVKPDATPEFFAKGLVSSRVKRRRIIAELERNQRLHPDSRLTQQWLTMAQTIENR